MKDLAKVFLITFLAVTGALFIDASIWFLRCVLN